MDRDGLGRAGPPDPECGEPGGGRGRRDEVGGSGVYPASAGTAPDDAVARLPAEWGQGDRGAAGYDDAGSSELFWYPVQLDDAETGTPGSSRAAPAPSPASPDPGGAAEASGSAGPAQPPTAAEKTKPPAEEVAAQRRIRWGGW